MSAILDATIRIFDRENFEAASTTHIAEVAGISIGTLYQYFADRNAILDALQDRELERATEMLEHALTSTDAQSGPEIARRVIAGLMELYRASPALHRVLVIEGLRVTPTDRVQAFDLRMVQRIRTFLSATPVPIRRSNLEVASFVVYHSVRATMLARLLEAGSFDDDELVDEIVDLVLRYLVSD